MRKSTKYAAVAIVLVGVLWLTGVFGALAGMLQSAGEKPPAEVTEVWEVLITAGTVATAAETAVISADSHTVDLYSGLADWQSVADADNIVLTFDLSNLNTGENTLTYFADGAITFVAQPAGGTGTAYLILKDGNGFWDVDYASYATGSEPNDRLRVSVVTAASDAGITATYEARALGFDNFQLSGNYSLVFTIEGIALVMAFHVTGA